MIQTKADLDELRGLDAYRKADAELRARLTELDTEADGKPFTADQRAEFEAISGTDGLLDQVTEAITELEIRGRVVETVIDGADRGTEREPAATRFGLPSVVKAPDNIFDLAAYRVRARSLDELPGLYRDGAMRLLERAEFPTADKAKAQHAVAKLLTPTRHREPGAVARRMLATGSPEYEEAWGIYATRGENAVPQRLKAVLQTYSDADGGYAIPFTIDPTFVNTSDGSVNPLRAISRVETITTKEWQAVTTAGMTAAYKATEVTATTSSAPADVANPTITPVEASSFASFTAAYQEDYGAAAIASEIGRMVQVAKDDLEATKFFMGSGTAEPDGIVARLITDTTSIVPTITNDVFALADVDKLIGALPPRFRSRAQMAANLAILQLVPAFGTAGQPSDSIYNAISKTLRGYPVHEASAMDDVATDAKEIVLMGDFSYFVIVDRLGVTSEYIPNLFDGDGKPLSERGILVRWRNDTGLLSVNAFRLLKVQ
jgi:HK97 family phage major capsid protein